MNLRLSTAGVAGALAIGIGAFGAHALEGRLTQDALAAFETGARFHLLHAAVLLAIALASDRLRAAFWTIAAGTVLFSGSLYALALTGARPFAFITPVGGVTLLLGWLLIAAAGWGKSRA